MNAPVDYLSLQLLVVLLQLVHLLQEAPQPGVQAPHGVRGVLRQVHGRLREHIRTFSRRTPALALPLSQPTRRSPIRPEGSENRPRRAFLSR